VQRRDLELFPARLADQLVVHADQVIAKLGKLRPIAFIGARRQAVLLDAPHPPHVVFIGTLTPWAGEARRASFVFVGEECAFVEGHGLVG
jgi:hypothetical protein